MKKQVVIKRKDYKKNKNKVKIIKKENSSNENKRLKSIKWTYKVNDLVLLKNSGEIALIVGEYDYEDLRIKSNIYEILVFNKIIKVNASSIKSIY